MHQDYTAMALLLFTALPLISVAVAAFFYVRNNERKTPLKGDDFRRLVYGVKAAVLKLVIICSRSSPGRLSCLILASNYYVKIRGKF